jgi:hypothetical protein
MHAAILTFAYAGGSKYAAQAHAFSWREEMKSWIRNTMVALALVGLVGGGSASRIAFAQAAPAKGAARREAHPVLQRSIRQLEMVKDELTKAPDDFHGHKEAAIDAVTHAMTELRAAIAADKK